MAGDRGRRRSRHVYDDPLDSPLEICVAAACGYLVVLAVACIGDALVGSALVGSAARAGGHPGWTSRQSSGVTFRGVAEAGVGLWRIGNVYYDLTPFLDRHPGGRLVLELARDRFGDCTYAFEAHHTDQPRVRAMLRRFRVDSVTPPQPAPLAERRPALCGPDSFYSVLRARVCAHLKKGGGTARPGSASRCGGPRFPCISRSGRRRRRRPFVCAVGLGLAAAVVGGFGHN